MAFTQGQKLTAAQLNSALAGYVATGSLSTTVANLMASTNLAGALGALGISASGYNTANGLLQLDATGLVPVSAMPSSVPAAWSLITGKPVLPDGPTVGTGKVPQWSGTSWTGVVVTPAWGSITGTPTTLAGYGITDAVAKTNVSNTFTQSQYFNAGPTLQGTANQTNNSEIMRVYAAGKNASGTALTFNSLINYVFNATAGSETSGYVFQSKINGVDTNIFWTGINGGIYTNTAGGGDKGLGTLNVTGLYINGALSIPTRATGSFYWNGSAIVTDSSINVASIVRNASADYTITFNNPMPSAAYTVVGNLTGNPGIGGVSIAVYSAGYGQAPTLKTTTQVRISIYGEPTASGGATFAIMGG
jgi:hypothetical protein